jgi:hypothetical protein
MSREYTPTEIEAALSGEFPEDHPNATKEVVEAEPAPVEEGDPAPVEEPEAEAPVETPEVEVTDEEALQAADDWEDKFKKLQSAKDREVAETQRELQRLREELAEKRGREAAQQEFQSQHQVDQTSMVTLEDLRPNSREHLAANFQWVVANRPDMVPGLVSMVRTIEGLGHDVADQMVVEYQEYKDAVREAAIEQRFKERDEREQASQAPLRQQQAMEGVVTGLTERFGENFVAVQDEIGERMQTDGRAYVEYLASEAAKAGEDFSVTPELLQEMMVDIYLEIREAALNANTNQLAGPEPVPATAGAIGGAASTGGTPDDNQEFLDGFMQGAKDANIAIDPTFLP